MKPILPGFAVLIFSLTACTSSMPEPSAPLSQSDIDISAAPPFLVPQGNAVSIDGTISPGEWDDARQELFFDGSLLFLKHAEGYLYLGIRSNTQGMIGGNIFIDRGSDIAILHTSAALGTAVYEEDLDDWQQTQAFVWRSRDTGQSDSAQSERLLFLEQEHWLAANARTGTPHELEYQIEVTDEMLRLAVTFIRTSDISTRIYWPTSLADDSIIQHPGEIPVRLHFSLEDWMTLILETN